MQVFQEFHTRLSALASDNDVMQELNQHFSGIGLIKHVDRFYVDNRFLDIGGVDRRTFIIQFKHSADAIKARNRYKLRSFGFDGVVVELKCAA